MFDHHFGFFGFIIFVLDIWAIINIVNSNRSVGKKVLWTLLVFFLPVLGFILWLFFGPRQYRY